jgi:hypothetical protein
MSKSIEQAEVALKEAESAFEDELKRDIERSEGSGAQERRREEWQESLRDDIAKCKRDLEIAQKNELGELP